MPLQQLQQQLGGGRGRGGVPLPMQHLQQQHLEALAAQHQQEQQQERGEEGVAGLSWHADA
jgi:hypothetical protein